MIEYRYIKFCYFLAKKFVLDDENLLATPFSVARCVLLCLSDCKRSLSVFIRSVFCMSEPTMDFYHTPISAPSRAVQLTAAAVGVKLNIKVLDLLKGEQNTPEFLAINPQHCVPTLVDGDLKLWESRAICAYLVNQHGKDDSLYPKEPKTRAIVDRALYFDMGTLYKRFGDYVYPPMFKGAPVDPGMLTSLMEALGWLDGYLAGRDYIAGSSITIADHSLVASVSTFVASGVDVSGHANVSAWLGRCKKTMPGYDLNEQGAKGFGDMAKEKLGIK
ncbi:Glutathione S-transferase N-terminal [Trinorchestia longiramus]|nr:Glutathione S-transferase N-terminal [Trinorchestia longiramus]